MSVIICAILGIICTDIYCVQQEGIVTDDIGKNKLAKADYTYTLNIAYSLAKPNATAEERKAGDVFLEFLDSWRSEEYIEAFYGKDIDHPNRFTQFLNAILYNANPSLPIWNAAEKLLNMISTKLDANEIEKLRELANTELRNSTTNMMRNSSGKALIPIKDNKNKTE